jgi:small conductance mechanosensitive channel
MPIVWAIVILVAAWIISKIVGNGVRRSLAKGKVDETLSRFFGKLAGYLILTLGVIFALSKFGIDVTSFAAILAAAGFAVGMALSGTLGNFAAGVMLLIFRPFKVGDYIVAGGTEGIVEEIELFTTTLNTLDNRHIILPNGLIHGAVIENVTFNKTRRVDVNVGVAYGASMKETRKVLLDGIANIQGALSEPGPDAYLVELGDSSVNWQVRVWCAPADYWAVRQVLTEAAKDALDAAGISIPFPQLDVHMDKAED